MARRRRARAKPGKRSHASRATTQKAKDAETLQLDVLLSINQAAHVFGRDRATLTKRIATFGITPKGKRRGHPVYSAKELHEKLNQFEDDGTRNPDRMTPFERQAHYRAEAEKNRVNLERGELVERIDVERRMARLAKKMAQGLDTIPDLIERDIGAAPMILARIEQQIDIVREEIYASIVADDEDEKADAATTPDST